MGGQRRAEEEDCRVLVMTTSFWTAAELRPDDVVIGIDRRTLRLVAADEVGAARRAGVAGRIEDPQTRRAGGGEQLLGRPMRHGVFTARVGILLWRAPRRFGPPR